MTLRPAVILTHALLAALLAAAWQPAAAQQPASLPFLASPSAAPVPDAADKPPVRNPYYNPLKKHHTPGGFRNNYRQAPDKGFLDFLRWQFSARSAGASPNPAGPAQAPVRAVAPEADFIHSNARAGAVMEPAITWIGHATLLVQSGGISVLTDPMFSQRAFPVQWAGYQRRQPPGLALNALPTIDAVVISHDHYDHLDEASVLALAAQAGGSPLFLVPLGLKPWFEQRGIARVKELDWYDSFTLDTPHGKTEFHLTPVQHWSSRILVDRQDTLWGGWAVFHPSFHWYFAGDSGYSKDFSDSTAHFAQRQTPALGGGFDVALLPIGAYQPEWFLEAQHMSPRQAVQVHRELNAKHSIAMHWGTFDFGAEPLHQPPLDLARARHAADLAETAFQTLAIGETRRLPRRLPAP